MMADGSNVHGRWLCSVHEPTSMRYHPRRRRNPRTRSSGAQCILRSSSSTRFCRTVSVHNRRRISWKPYRIYPLDTGCARSEANRGAVLQIHWRDQKREKCQGMLHVPCLLLVVVVGGWWLNEDWKRWETSAFVTDGKPDQPLSSRITGTLVSSPATRLTVVHGKKWHGTNDFVARGYLDGFLRNH
jgi:hypothetical protein